MINKRQRKPNGQCRDTANLGRTTHRTKKNKTKNTSQKTKNKHPPKPEPTIKIFVAD